MMDMAMRMGVRGTAVAVSMIVNIRSGHRLGSTGDGSDQCRYTSNIEAIGLLYYNI
jgi:hypothetical protein